jgi:hypothetical protein
MVNIIKKIARRYTNNAKQWKQVVPQTIKTIKSSYLADNLAKDLMLQTYHNDRDLQNAIDSYNRGEFTVGTYWGETKTFPENLQSLRRYKK